VNIIFKYETSKNLKKVKCLFSRLPIRPFPGKSIFPAFGIGKMIFVC